MQKIVRDLSFILILQVRKVFLAHNVELLYTHNRKGEYSTPAMPAGFKKKQRRNRKYILILKTGFSNVVVDYKS